MKISTIITFVPFFAVISATHAGSKLRSRLAEEMDKEMKSASQHTHTPMVRIKLSGLAHATTEDEVGFISDSIESSFNVAYESAGSKLKFALFKSESLMSTGSDAGAANLGSAWSSGWGCRICPKPDDDSFSMDLESVGDEVTSNAEVSTGNGSNLGSGWTNGWGCRLCPKLDDDSFTTDTEYVDGNISNLVKKDTVSASAAAASIIPDGYYTQVIQARIGVDEPNECGCLLCPTVEVDNNFNCNDMEAFFYKNFCDTIHSSDMINFGSTVRECSISFVTNQNMAEE